ncbi:hypothetical protein PM082_020736 [Marasmius tenuissimus]|nr:hypothetical protein PM082_020736 [Marasmius tenuissimus]
MPYVPYSDNLRGCYKPGLRPKPQGFDIRLGLKARAQILMSLSPQSRAQARGFEPSPSPRITIRRPHTAEAAQGKIEPNTYRMDVLSNPSTTGPFGIEVHRTAHVQIDKAGNVDSSHGKGTCTQGDIEFA